MAFCEDCGSPLSEGVAFCENCGAKISSTNNVILKILLNLQVIVELATH